MVRASPALDSKAEELTQMTTADQQGCVFVRLGCSSTTLSFLDHYVENDK